VDERVVTRVDADLRRHLDGAVALRPEDVVEDPEHLEPVSPTASTSARVR
jgi:hypothetical protein